MLVGEAPGYWENEEGRPFVGQAGRLLEQLLADIGLRREDVFITNVLKCRPPNNRDPLPDEMAACNDYLDRQIALIQPRLIVTLGRFSMAKFFGPGRGMRELHGKTVRYGQAVCLAVYHPAAALRQAALRAVLEEDFGKIPGLLAATESAAEAAEESVPPAPPPEQLSLF
jgi:DNA polymerase